MSKRETEKMVKEIWKDKMAEMKSGRQMEMTEFIFQHLQKRVGIVTAVVEVRGKSMAKDHTHKADFQILLQLIVL